MKVKTKQKIENKLNPTQKGLRVGKNLDLNPEGKKELQGEFQKIKPPTFDGEKEEDVEA